MEALSAHAAYLAGRMLEFPFMVRCGFELLEHAPLRASGAVRVTPELAGVSGHLNGTELYGLVDCTAFLAVATTLSPEEAAVTHDAHFSITGAAPTDALARFDAVVAKRGRTTAFIRVEVACGDRLVALATITKTILPLSVRNRHAPKP